MFNLRLYESNNPSHLLESRMANEHWLCIGRHPECDWVLEDPERFVSRRHLALRVAGSTLVLRALGANGVYVGDPPVKLPLNVDTTLAPNDVFSFGPFKIEIERCPAAPVPDCVADGTLNKHGDSLLNAFCEGAGLDPSQFISADPAVLMRKAGEIYRKAVSGLSEMLRERAAFRAQLTDERTLIAPADNNLLKWAPPHRIHCDLLSKDEPGFIAGAEAVRLSIFDLRAHIAGIMAGHMAVVNLFHNHLSEGVTDRHELVQAAFEREYAAAVRRFEANGNTHQ